MRTIVVIPARYESSRFPGKPLVSLLGKPMVLWVAELSEKAVGKANVYVATDDSRIAEVVIDAGYQVIMTGDALTGTDRLAEAARKVSADIYINIQGDEPLVDPQDIVRVIEEKKLHFDAVINCYCELSESEDPGSVNIPKVIFSEGKKLVYMSRKVLPGYKDCGNAPKKLYKQVCIYAFNRKQLADFENFGRKSKLESSEDIEIIRFLEWGQEIRMVEAVSGSLAVDVVGDVIPVEAALQSRF
ncbi:3-deoxy-manno-octulosonate cytidylyltransferase (CMP-KDO synthetase) [Zhongshania antarctica]|uniref:3-deoxy-manno-octulosonate cytidylyltransferase (CMP-KDO synthetase) n=1 Tax=Zhongshania antarctica TaxID=641702 RepID=A0A840R579_9GAMM|nr:3-deoxy-manno-octulosonate cytidylyltransferase [Zhongshania antarctica]MBB5187724.1 3-deoxy-manno-octulosonate cytidylyltransferase (CMP-KDO synthetase) [Zhongshania antarctica]